MKRFAVFTKRASGNNVVKAHGDRWTIYDGMLVIWCGEEAVLAAAAGEWLLVRDDGRAKPMEPKPEASTDAADQLLEGGITLTPAS